MTRLYLTNCRLVLPDTTTDDASLLIDEDKIAAVCPDGVAGHVQEWDLEKSTVMAGMIDLHSDAIESLAEPRSGIYLPFDLAASQADQLAATHGITTFYNAISFAGEELGLRKGDAPARLVEAVHNFRSYAKTDQRVHCRYEVTVDEALPKILSILDKGMCSFVSYMDHSPGQGQFQDEANYRSYMSARYGYNDEMITQLLQSKTAEAKNPNAIESRVRELARKATQLRVPFAGHDADSEVHVREMVELGAVLAEFPMTEEAAKAGVEHGLHQSVGSVNVIRGGSQRTGMSAASLIAAKQADCLCSDYVPATLLPAVLKMANSENTDLHDVAKVVTANPAMAAGLTDRGQIKEGLRADLLAFQVDELNGIPKVVATWSAGNLVYCSRMPTADRLCPA